MVYTTYLKGLDQGSDYISFRGISTDNPHISQEFIEEQAKSLPIEIFKQEYLAEFSEATNDVFRNLDNVCILNEWSQPQRNTGYYYGIDTGFANDFTVCSIIEESGRIAKILRFNGSTFEEAGKTLCAELRKYGVRGGYTERNGVGEVIFELIRSEGIRVTGFVTTQESKTRGVRKLIGDIEEGNIMLPSKQLMPECYNELSSFTYKISANGGISFTHPSGFHDDIVDSLWLANLARNEIIGKRSSLYVGGGKMSEAAGLS